MKGHPSRNNIFSGGKIGFLQRLVHHFRNSAGDNILFFRILSWEMALVTVCHRLYPG